MPAVLLSIILRNYYTIILGKYDKKQELSDLIKSVDIPI